MRRVLAMTAAFIAGTVLGLSGTAAAHQSSTASVGGPTTYQMAAYVPGEIVNLAQTWTNVRSLSVSGVCSTAPDTEVSATVSLPPVYGANSQYAVRVLVNGRLAKPPLVVFGPYDSTSSTFVARVDEGPLIVRVQWEPWYEPQSHAASAILNVILTGGPC